MLLKCLICIVLRLTECLTQDATANLVNGHESSVEPFSPNKDEWFPRVLNGAPARLGDVPYQVSLKKQLADDLYMSFCGGSLISEKKVLSAAHCFLENIQTMQSNFSHQGIIPGFFLMDRCAVAGCLQNRDKYTQDDDKAQWRKLSVVRYPEDFKFPNNDIAVVYVFIPFTYTKYVSPIPIASKNLDYSGTCLVSGYGRTSHIKKNAISDVLLLAQLELITQSTCSILQLNDIDSFVCTDVQYSDVGKGDSGGPLVCANTGDPNEGSRGLLVGVICGHVTSSYSFYSRVSKYYDFIEKDLDLVPFVPNKFNKNMPRNRKNSSMCIQRHSYLLLVVLLKFVHTYLHTQSDAFVL